MFESIDLGAIMEEKTRELVKGLLNFIEQLSSSLREARAEIQRLRDENNRLKGPSARQAEDQSECGSGSNKGSLIGKGTKETTQASGKKEGSEHRD